ncbi:glycerate kinase [Nitriliruptor alkaliphilus]|uniref:glycerate kinase n=1 Tax=Nitriliruptor alkaliphilus TaxID=427918 RepID=UPI000698C1B6|nr:glycerate kinase [Nitriliruptor alkaliphilus]
MKVVLAPDAFKGSASAPRVAAALGAGWREVRPHDEVIEAPLADGGEGTAEVLGVVLPGARYHHAEVVDPVGRPHLALWAELPDGTAVIDLAAACGLPLLDRLDPLGSHTFGLGQLLGEALDHGATRLLVGLGGSASTDGGCGALAALGARFLDADGAPLSLGGAALRGLSELDLSDLRPPPVGGVQLLSDVRAPLLGDGGSAAVFGPQKGAEAQQIAVLEAGLGRLLDVASVSSPRSKEVAQLPGAGAGGGTGFGLAALWSGELLPGASTVADLVGLDAMLAGADVVVTGEGAFDVTSTTGKVVGSLLDRVPAHVEVALVAGRIDGVVPGRVSDHVELIGLAGTEVAATTGAEAWIVEAGRALASHLGVVSPGARRR